MKEMNGFEPETRFEIGGVQVDCISDLDRVDMPIGVILPQADRRLLARSRAFLEPVHADLARDVLHLAIQTFVLRVEGRTILIDTCVGENKERPAQADWHRRDATGFLARLAAAGVRPESVDAVFCTHLHADHIGWNTQRVDGRWTPAFPNARYLIGRNEMAHWRSVQAEGPSRFDQPLDDSVLPVVAAGQVDLVDDGYEPAAGLTLLPLPGHTPGQMGLNIDRGGQRAVFCGDAIHTPVQVLHPQLSTGFCVDPDLARQTRIALLQSLAERGGWLAPAHFRGARRARIRAVGDGFFPDFA